LDAESPFIGLGDKMDRFLDGSSNINHPLDFTEVDLPNNARGNKATRTTKHGTNYNSKPNQNVGVAASSRQHFKDNV
jgi:hypothetical protein